MSGPYRQPLAEKLWRYVDQRRADECWPWTGASTGGRGYISHGAGVTLRATRVMWTVVHGPIPEGMSVCHECDNPNCMNPAHLWLGTPADNAADMVAKGRQVRQHPNRPRGPRAATRSKLTDLQVVRIRQSPQPAAELAHTHGVSPRTIRDVRCGKTYSWITTTEELPAP